MLIINSDQNIKPLNSFFKALSEEGRSLFFITNKRETFLPAEKNFKTQTKKLPKLDKKYKIYFFTALIPLNFIRAIIFLKKQKRQKKIKTIVCCGLSEKITYTLPAKILKLKAIWLEIPEQSPKNHYIASKLFKICSKSAQIVVFNNFNAVELVKKGVKKESIKQIKLGLGEKQSLRQKNLFSTIAEKKYLERNKKFFTIGTILDLNYPQKTEQLLNAVKKCLTVIPHQQLIIVGDGKERKRFMWLSKKLEIDSFVWFVGQQENPNKWYENFDLYISASSFTTLTDINNLLGALKTDIPIIAPSQIGWEDYVENKINGIIYQNNSEEELVQSIITVYKNRNFFKEKNRIEKERLKEGHLITATLSDFKELLD